MLPRHRLLTVVTVCAWWFAAPAGAQSPAPKEAWPILKAHFAEVEQYRSTQERNIAELQDLMAGAPAFKAERAAFVALWHLLGAHNDGAYYVWSSRGSSMGRSLNTAQMDF